VKVIRPTKEVAMTATSEIVLLWMLFGASHMILSSQMLRPKIVKVVGPQVFQGVYSLLALLIFVPLVALYFGNKHSGPLLWSLPGGLWLLWTVQIGMGVAFVLLVAGLVKPSPASIGASGNVEAGGALLITRHPLLMSFALFGALHLLVNPFASDVAFFGGMAVFVLVGTWHQDRRKLATMGDDYQRFYDATPFLPFTGRETLRGLRELGPVALGVGIGLTFLVRYFHGAWFGG
jgi:uncharacterized membrane protein